MRSTRLACLIGWAVVCALLQPAWAQQDETELTGLELEQLLDVEVVTASRRPEVATLTAAAVTVLTQEDIRRSGTTTLPDLLRRVPSLRVVKEDTDSWSIGVRGFTGIRNAALLVLVDGRPVTSPSLSGVLWSAQTVPLETIERVEVIRGACTSLWGLDSFNGVINVITKRAENAQAEQAVTTVGTTGISQQFLAGGTVGEAGHWRGSTGISYADGAEFEGGRDASRYWTRQDAGFRVDLSTGPTDEFSVQGAVHSSSIDKPMPLPFPEATAEEQRSYSGHMQVVWDHATGLGTGIHARSSYTRAQEMLGDMSGVGNVADLEVQYSLRGGDAHHLVMGTGGRIIWDEFENGNSVQADFEETMRWEWNGFVQDRIQLPVTGLDLIVGVKLDKAGKHLEVQPTTRLTYDQGNNVFWGAVSQAVRSADRWGRKVDMEVWYNGTRYTLSEAEDLESEKLTAWELGWRRPGKVVSMDLALFINEYEDMLAVDIDTAANQAYISNDMTGTTYGAEYVLTWQAAPALQVTPSITWLHHSWTGLWVDNRGGMNSPPEHSWEPKIQLAWDVSEDVLMDAYVYHSIDSEDPEDNTTNLDASISWRIDDQLMLDLMGSSLLGSRETTMGQREAPGASLRVTWSF